MDVTFNFHRLGLFASEYNATHSYHCYPRYQSYPIWRVFLRMAVAQT